MADIVYNWKRYWVPRDGVFSFGSDGFLQPPLGDADGVVWWKTDATGFDKLLSKPCLVLLGEPGIGKSFAIRDAENGARTARTSAGANFLSRDLGSYNSDAFLIQDVFGSPEFSRWQEEGGELHIFLDSFDECLLRVDAVAALLAEQFGRLQSVQNLYLRITSRTAEWQTALEDALRQKWGEESVGVYELAPLTREQVLDAARAHLPEPERFVQQIIASEVVSFAMKPLTLDLLLRAWSKHGEPYLPRSGRFTSKAALSSAPNRPDARRRDSCASSPPSRD